MEKRKTEFIKNDSSPVRSEFFTLQTGLLIFFDNLNFQKVKFDFFDKTVLVETGFGMELKIPDGGIQPDRVWQIKRIADFFQSAKHFMRTGVCGFFTEYRIVD